MLLLYPLRFVWQTTMVVDIPYKKIQKKSNIRTSIFRNARLIEMNLGHTGFREFDTNHFGVRYIVFTSL